MAQFSFEPGQAVLTGRLEGRMDLAASQQLERDLQEALSANPVKQLVLDLAAVDYIASAFLRVCLAGEKQVGAGGLAVVNASPRVAKIFNVAGLGELLA